MAAADKNTEVPASEVARQFVKLYYAIQRYLPNLAHKFYDETSVLGRPRNDVMHHFCSLESIKEELNICHHKYVPRSYRAQASFDGRVCLVVFGSIFEEVEFSFVQVFLLYKPPKGNYTVAVDILEFPKLPKDIIADLFVNLYYTVSPNEAHLMYEEKSQISRPDSRNRLEHFTTLRSISEVLRRTDRENFATKTVEARVTGEGIIVLVKGCTGEKFFMQSFFLARRAFRRFYVLNDIVWFSEKSFDSVVPLTFQHHQLLKPDEEIPILRRSVPPTYEALKELLKELRLRLGQKTSPFDGIPVTRNEINLMHLVLLSNDATTDLSEVMFKLFTDNAYKLGVKLPFLEQWLEFSPKFPGIRLIPTSNLLGFTNSYPSMEDACDKSLADLWFSISSLSEAFNKLSNPSNIPEFSEGLMRNTATYCEGTRLWDIEKLFRKPRGERFGSQNMSRVRVWGKIGRFYIFAKVSPKSFEGEYTKLELENILKKIEGSVALLKCLTFPISSVLTRLVEPFVTAFKDNTKKRRNDLYHFFR